MRVLALLLCCLLVCCSYTQSTTSTYDPFAALVAEQTAKLKLVQKVVDITYTYSLQSTNTWQQFPDMNIQFRLKYPQFVSIDYNIVLWTNGNNYLCTRVMVDNVENRRFRSTTGDTRLHSNSQSQKVWMEAGLHWARVEFKNSGTISNQNLQDWNGAFFKVEYYVV